MLLHGDCLELMKQIPDGSVDMILTDPPYGTTACKWDNVIPFEPMWEQIWRVLKPNGACLLFGSEPFSSALRMSQIKRFKYDWVWVKERPSNPLMANKQVLKYHETISVFYNQQSNFFPQLRQRDLKNKRKNKPRIFESQVTRKVPNSEGMNQTGENDLIKPKSVIEFSMQRGLHPTQKPVALLEYLIKTYTLEGETVLDFTMGSGSTGVACMNTGRKFIGIEMDDKYFEIASKRIAEAKPSGELWS
jgi:site-specific DNA-methyltransferase (adenine-specific)